VISEVKQIHDELCAVFRLTVEVEKAIYEMKVPFVWTSDFIAQNYTPLAGTNTIQKYRGTIRALT
jgi:hypothetical protein